MKSPALSAFHVFLGWLLGSALVQSTPAWGAESSIPRESGQVRRGSPLNLHHTASQKRTLPPAPAALVPAGTSFQPHRAETLSPIPSPEARQLPLLRPPVTTSVSGFPSLADLTPSPLPTLQFESAVDDGSRLTPDTAGAAGPTQVVTVVNSEVRVHDREGQTLASITLDQFFSTFGDDIVTYDPRCVFDPFANRWILTAAANLTSPDAAVVVAVSTSSDALGDWFRYYLDVDSLDELYADSPTVGFNKKWIVIQANLFDQVTDEYVESEVMVLDKLDWYEGGNSSPGIFHLAAADHGWSHVPAVTLDGEADSLYLVQNWNGKYVDPVTRLAQGRLHIYQMTGPVGQESLLNGPFVSTAQEVTRPIFTWADTLPSGRDLGKQVGTTNRIQLGDSRIQSVMYRGGSLWCAQTVLLPAANPTRSGVVWWEVFPDDGRIFQRHLIEDARGDWSYAYPSLAVNDHYDVLVGYNGFGNAVHPTAYYRFYPNDGVYNNPLGEQVAHVGEGIYEDASGGPNYWGGWSATCVDPLNDGAFWTLQQYALPPLPTDPGRWGVQWCLVTPPYDLQLTSRASTNRVVVGQELTWTLVLSNRARSFGYNVTVTNPIPAGFEIISLNPSAGSAVAEGSTLYWDFYRVGVETNLLRIVGRVIGDTLGVTNSAGVWAFGPDAVPTNNVTRLEVPLMDGVPVVPPVLALAPSDGQQLTLAWPVGYLGFVVEARDSLTSGSWQPLGVASAPAGAVQVLPLAPDQRGRYFRLRRK